MEPARTRHRLLAPLPVERGFTLVEMLVVLSIILIITSIALVGQSNFNRSLLLTDTAYTIALSIRESQSLGLSSRRVGITEIQNAGYGVYFTTGNTYLQFADTSPIEPGDDLDGICPGHDAASGPEAKPGDCLYQTGADTVMKTYRFERGFKVSKFCGKPAAGGALACSDSASPLTSLHVSFLRPNTESVIIGKRGASDVELTSAHIYIQSADASGTRGVCVSQVGQVSVATSTCP